MLVVTEAPDDLREISARREHFALEWRKAEALFFQGQPDFDAPVGRVHKFIDVM